MSKRFDYVSSDTSTSNNNAENVNHLDVDHLDVDAVTNMAADLNVSKIIEEGDSGDQFNPELTDRPFAWQEMG